MQPAFTKRNWPFCVGVIDAFRTEFGQSVKITFAQETNNQFRGDSLESNLTAISVKGNDLLPSTLPTRIAPGSEEKKKRSKSK